MLVAFLAALVVVNVMYVWLLDRKDTRYDAQVQRLCQRIQAPEQAVLEHAVTPREGPLFSNEFSEDDQFLEGLMDGRS